MLTYLSEQGLNLFTYRSFRDEEGRLLLDGTNNVTERAMIKSVILCKSG